MTVSNGETQGKERDVGFKEKVENQPVLWVLGTLLAGFLAGIGTYEGALQITGRTIVAEAAVTESQKREEALLKKDRFLSLFLRYEQAEGFEDKASSRQALDDYVSKFIDDADKVESVVKVGKGAGTQTKVIFPDAEWTIPPDLRAATRP